ARDRKGLTRMALSAASGVSQRYLAQIEAGAGNVSIALLLRVAVALDCRVEWLTAEDDPWTSDAFHVADLFRRAGAEAKARALTELGASAVRGERSRRIALVGLRGAGKSTLGAALGRRFATQFVELDRDIEEQAGMPVADVMALYGAEGYRRLERQAIERIAATHPSLVLAVAGGVVTEPETYRALLADFSVVWIKASPAEHMERVRAQGDTRPMAGNPEAMKQLEAILDAREAQYARADARIDTQGKSAGQSADELAALVEARGWL
ncbi:MAG: helix-turn-helix transcriptional regulator, partial [Hyphomicrobiales bacterium]|nr:helix-turn-helix transcriptional regulator [Hyphomicrobiales bacterium]